MKKEEILKRARELVKHLNFDACIEAYNRLPRGNAIIDVEEIKTLVIEGLKTREEFSRKAAMLEEERKAAMEKYKDISISA